jgi:endonuclease/exonuclease/phosphatase family metal-dependent hydrolase
MHKAAKLLLVLVLTSSTLVPARAQDHVPPVKESPPGQVTVVTLNAHQFPILGIRRFRKMFQLSRALRRRPMAFDGGFFGAIQAPDVIVLQEMRPSNAEIFEHILRQRFQVKYRIITPSDVAATIIAHPDTVSLVGEITPLADACSITDDRYPNRRYPIARFVENESDTTFAVVGIHFPKGGQAGTDCLSSNVEQMRTLFEVEQTPTIIAGDFNRRPVRDPFECDPNEESEALPWYSALTAPDNGGRQYLDSVREFNRTNSISMEYEWTHEQKAKKVACTGNVHYRRTRIDYIFAADAAIAEAHADHPGWGGEIAGRHHPENFKYSDHRWVWARIVLGGPRRPERPELVPAEGGEMHVAWEGVEGATGWVVYRALGERAFGVVERLPAEATSYDDVRTKHGKTYRYAVAPTGPSGGQGVESWGATGFADALGPRATAAYPVHGSIGVGPGQAMSVRFDENVVKDSVNQNSLRLYVDGHTVRGVVLRKFPRLLKFNPSNPLKKGKVYTAVVAYGLRDQLGNEGSRFAWRFRTEEPPPKKRRERTRRG